MFTVFKRSSYIRNESGDLIPGPGPMHIIRRNLTEDQARRFCQRMNDSLPKSNLTMVGYEFTSGAVK